MHMVLLRAIKVEALFKIREDAPSAALEPHSGAQVQSAADGGSPGTSSAVADPAAGTRFNIPPRNGRKRQAPNLDLAGAWEFIGRLEVKVAAGDGDANERKARTQKRFLFGNLLRVTKVNKGNWQTKVPNKHIMSKHPGTDVGKKGEKSASAKKWKLQMTLNRMGSFKGRKQLTAAQITTVEVTRLYVYSRQQITKRGFYKLHCNAMMSAEFNAGFDAGAGKHSEIIPHTQTLLCEAQMLFWVLV